MAAFWQLEGLKETTWTPRVQRGNLYVSGHMYPLDNVHAQKIIKVGTPRRRNPGGWPGQAAGVIFLGAVVWACFMVFEVFDPVYWIGPAALTVIGVLLLSYGMRGVPCPPFACLEIEFNSGKRVRIFAYDKDGELERLRDAIGAGMRDQTHDWSESLVVLTNADSFCKMDTDKVEVVR
ncbi:hypothetical protein [Myceligenerans crystallogenes]|uniref:Uncharacterized protein n=1 Tax=Myceligenerans crystallogenes TaxID=316335 RepID=A0ABP4ZTJ6_9MICO